MDRDDDEDEDDDDDDDEIARSWMKSSAMTFKSKLGCPKNSAPDEDDDDDDDNSDDSESRESSRFVISLMTLLTESMKTS